MSHFFRACTFLKKLLPTVFAELGIIKQSRLNVVRFVKGTSQSDKKILKWKIRRFHRHSYINRITELLDFFFFFCLFCRTIPRFTSKVFSKAIFSKLKEKDHYIFCKRALHYQTEITIELLQLKCKSCV